MSQALSKDFSFKIYWSEPTDENVQRFYSKSNWDWLNNLQDDNCAKEKVAEAQHLSCVERELKDEHLKSVRSRIDEDGYYSSANSASAPVARYTNEISGIDRMRSAIQLLVSHGYPATFVLLLDECWDAVQSMTETMAAGTGNSICNMDILAWQVDPQKGSGFSPHRDRQPDDVSASFRPDGTPKYATCWLALGPAHCDNSCLYVIPKYLDPGYSESDFPPSATVLLPESSKGKSKKTRKSLLTQEPIVSDPLSTALKDKESYQHIRALPLNPGEYVIFTHRIMHWGSKGRKSYKGEPRISLSVAFSDPTFEAPYFVESLTGHPSFEMRLALACAQMIIYYQRYFFSDGELLLFKKCFDCQAHIFNAEYRRKVLFEYSSAVLEIENAKEGGQSNPAPSAPVQTVPSSEGTVHRSEMQRNGSNSAAVDSVRIETEDKDDFDDHSDDFNGEDIDDDDDEDEGSGPEDEDEDESEEDEDGGFFDSEEGGKDDPLEHALDAMLDIEAEAITAHKKARKK